MVLLAICDVLNSFTVCTTARKKTENYMLPMQETLFIMIPKMHINYFLIWQGCKYNGVCILILICIPRLNSLCG